MKLKLLTYESQPRCDRRSLIVRSVPRPNYLHPSNFGNDASRIGSPNVARKVTNRRDHLVGAWRLDGVVADVFQHHCLDRHLADAAEERLHLGAAVRLLSNPRNSLTEVADRLGFSDLSSFSQAYKRWTGLAPSQSPARNGDPLSAKDSAV